MKEIIPKLIYLIIMPCRKATLELEKERVGRLSFFERWRLKLHLHVCDLCSSYKEKIEIMDRYLEKKAEKEKFENTEIQHFIENTKRKIEKS